MSTPPSPKPGDPVHGLSFEQALEQVEGIVERVEQGEIGLERSLAEYERGVALIRHCRAILDRAEQRIEELTAQMDAGRVEAPKDGAPPDDESAGG